MIALLEPHELSRFRRQGFGRASREALRVEARSAHASLPAMGRRYALVELDPIDEPRLRADPLLRRARVLCARELDRWLAGAARALELDPRRDGGSPLRDRDLDVVERIAEAPRELLVSSTFAFVRARARTTPRSLHATLRFSPRRAREPAPIDAVLVPYEALHSAFESWRARSDIAWETLRIRTAPSGAIVEGVAPRPALFPLGSVFLTRVPLGGERELFVEQDIEIPACASAASSDARATIVHVDRGRIAVESTSGEPVRAIDLLAPIARIVRPDGPKAKDAGGSGVDEGAEPANELRSARALGELEAWLRPREGAGRVDDDPLASGEITTSIAPRPEESDPPKASEEKRGWRRYLSPSRLLRSYRERRTRRADPSTADARRGGLDLTDVREPLLDLVRRLSGKRWREALPIAFPLRSPGRDGDSSGLLASEIRTISRTVDFSLDGEAKLARHARIEIGPEVYHILEILYDEAARRLLANGEHRAAAYVLSFLLGRHAQAASALEQGGFPREAATVWYHLAALPRRAAIALERGGAVDEAARLWMDIGEWRRAAIAWDRARSREQADAAWRKHAMDLRESGREIEAARILGSRLADPRGALELLEPILPSTRPDAIRAAELSIDLALRLGEPARARRSIEEAIAIALDDAVRSPRRLSIARLLRWVERLAAWTRDRRRREALRASLLERAWPEAAAVWARSRGHLPEGARTELDAELDRAARATGLALRDPLLLLDVAKWIEREEERDRAIERSSASRARETMQVELGDGDRARAAANAPSASRCLTRREEEIGLEIASIAAVDDTPNELFVAGTPAGEIVALDEELAETRRLDTATARPVSFVRAQRGEVYASVANEVLHFTASATRRASERPAQIERTLPGTVTGLLLFPDATGLLRVSSRGAHVLHPHHLRPLESVEAEPRQTLVGAALNHRFVALLFSQGRASVDDPIRHEVRVLERRVRSRLSDLKLVETFTIARWPLAAIELVDSDGDDIVLWGEDWLVHYPSRREDFSVHELAIGTDRGRLPRARVLPRPSNATLIVVYGSGAAEEFALDRSERTWLVEARGGRLDPVVDAGRRGPPHEIWIARRSGKLVRLRHRKP